MLEIRRLEDNFPDDLSCCKFIPFPHRSQMLVWMTNRLRKSSESSASEVYLFFKFAFAWTSWQQKSLLWLNINTSWVSSLSNTLMDENLLCSIKTNLSFDGSSSLSFPNVFNWFPFLWHSQSHFPIFLKGNFLVDLTSFSTYRNLKQISFASWLYDFLL